MTESTRRRNGRTQPSSFFCHRCFCLSVLFFVYFVCFVDSPRNTRNTRKKIFAAGKDSDGLQCRGCGERRLLRTAIHQLLFAPRKSSSRRNSPGKEEETTKYAKDRKHETIRVCLLPSGAHFFRLFPFASFGSFAVAPVGESRAAQPCTFIKLAKTSWSKI